MDRPADPYGTIKHVRDQLPKGSKVRKSKYCDLIIAWRMQSYTLQEIQAELAKREEEISLGALSTAFKGVQFTEEIRYTTELAEKMGGQLELDHVKELAHTIFLQTRRVGQMVRDEAISHAPNPLTGAPATKRYNNNIRREMEVLAHMIAQYHAILKTPVEMAEEMVAAEQVLTESGLSEDAIDEVFAKFLEEKMISGELSVDNLVHDEF